MAGTQIRTAISCRHSGPSSSLCLLSGTLCHNLSAYPMYFRYCMVYQAYTLFHLNYEIMCDTS